MLALAYPGSTPAWWADQMDDDRLIATAISTLET